MSDESALEPEDDTVGDFEPDDAVDASDPESPDPDEPTPDPD